MTFRFGIFQFDDGSGELWRDGVRIRLEPQPARALTLLLSRAGELVSRDDLRQHLWGDDTHVDFDRGMAYCIGQVRSALSDSGENPRFVQTLTRRGFRFIAPVEAVEGTGLPRRSSLDDARAEAGGAGLPRRSSLDDARAEAGGVARGSRLQLRWIAAAALVVLATAGVWAAWSRLSTARPIVAVTVFDNETGLPEYDRLAAGAADVMVDALTALGASQIGVIGNAASVRQPRSARDPRAIRRETGAGYLVIGQVQNDDGGIRMLTHLIRLDDETHLWVTRVVRSPEAVAGIEAVSAARLADAVRQHVIEQRPDAPRFTR
jgi:DNA-binding winged helix-turn-helix (wHTH) protein/TolB-like protein